MDLEALSKSLLPGEGPPEGVSAAVALVLAGEDCDLLLIERAKREGDRWSGHAALPGGRRQSGDADLIETARRETLEETGVDLARARLLGRLADVEPLSRRPPRVTVRPFVFALPFRPPVAAGPEAAGHLWFCADRLRDCAGEADVLDGGEHRRMPAFLCGSYVVWGMTFRILSQLLDAAGAPPIS